LIITDSGLNVQTESCFLSIMDLNEAENLVSRNQSGYMLFGIYNFTGTLKGFSVSNFAGIQTSPRYDRNFLQNRFALSYKF